VGFFHASTIIDPMKVSLNYTCSNGLHVVNELGPHIILKDKVFFFFAQCNHKIPQCLLKMKQLIIVPIGKSLLMMRMYFKMTIPRLCLFQHEPLSLALLLSPLFLPAFYCVV